MIMPAMQITQNEKLNQNLRSVLGTSMKKLVNSSVLAVAPQVMSISNCGSC